MWKFVTEPDLEIGKVSVLTNKIPDAPGYVFTSPYAEGEATGQVGTSITDNNGNPVWFKAVPGEGMQNLDFRVQELNGKPVLTTWQGTAAGGPGYNNLPEAAPEPGACYYIYDQAYNVVKTVSAQNGWTADLHEFVITPQNTALFITFQTVQKDLSQYGGPSDGYVGDYGVQEVDLNTGNLVFSWDMLDHVSLSDSYETAASANSSNGNVWDVFHMNSLDLNAQGQLLISSRNMWAGYTVDRGSGNILWQIGGKQQSNEKWPLIKPDSGAAFSWQHMMRFRGPDQISLFDDACCGTKADGSNEAANGRTRGLVINVNQQAKTATTATGMYHSPASSTTSQGSVQKLPSGNWFVGWGDQSYYSEYAPAGNTASTPTTNLLYDVRLAGDNISYRAFRNTWVGLPASAPKGAAQTVNGATKVYASWNGSTQTVAWQVLSGSDSNSMAVIVPRAKRDGFETTIPVTGSGTNFQVKALDAQGNVIGTSETFQLS